MLWVVRDIGCEFEGKKFSPYDQQRFTRFSTFVMVMRAVRIFTSWAQLISHLMRNLFYLLILFLVSCSDKSSDKNECFVYPSKIDDLDSRDLYDNARWILFNWLGPQKLDEVYYGQMELRFRSVLSKNDTIEIFFLFCAPDSSSMEKTKPIPVARASVAFRHDTKKRLWAYVYPFEDFSDSLESGDELLEAPPSDTAINFMKSHRNILDS
jgi:hypothetical protein